MGSSLFASAKLRAHGLFFKKLLPIHLAAGGVERGYQQQLQGVNSAYKLNLEANQLNFAGAMKAADALKESGLKAVKLEQMSQIVTTLSRDLARRAELALTLRY
jgi:hypothetical protein